ncbi:hypothetical protein pb186bvf_000767 [Paramecium bursaria]
MKGLSILLKFRLKLQEILYFFTNLTHNYILYQLNAIFNCLWNNVCSIILIKSLLALALLIIGLYEFQEPNDETFRQFFPFDWMWIFFLGKLFALLFIPKEDPADEAQREKLLSQERDMGLKTFIPTLEYVKYASYDIANIFLLLIQIQYMNFGLFVMVFIQVLKEKCQSLCFLTYSIIRNNRQILYIANGALAFFGGVFALAWINFGSKSWYVGMIAAFLQIILSWKTSDYQEIFQNEYVISNPKLIGICGIIQFVCWSFILAIVQFIPCGNETKCQDNKLAQTQKFFSQTFVQSYPLIIFIIVLFLGTPLSYLDNKILYEKALDKKKVIELMIFFPIQLWIFLSDNQKDKLFVELSSILCFLFYNKGNNLDNLEKRSI